jgi:hypothetical protein
MRNIPKFTSGLALICAPFVIPTTVYANADRDATSEEKAKVVETLKQNDCPAVSDVDYVQNMGFEADVKCNDGKEYDVVLDDSFNITSKREDVD